MIIDFHSHILPAVDDGAQTPEISVEMLKAMKSQGIDVVLATSHYYHLRQSFENFVKKREESYKQLKDALFSVGLEEGVSVPKILLGSEASYAFEIEKFEKLQELCIEGTNVLLLEMPFRRWNMEEINAISSIALNRDIVVVIAHIERYIHMQNKDIQKAFFELPAYFQINAERIISSLGRKPLINMLEKGQVQLLGSDSHNMADRAPNLGAARLIIEKKLGIEKLNELDETAKKILNL